MARGKKLFRREEGSFDMHCHAAVINSIIMNDHSF